MKIQFRGGALLRVRQIVLVLCGAFFLGVIALIYYISFVDADFGQGDNVRRSKVGADFTAMSSALRIYKLNSAIDHYRKATGTYPSTAQGLAALVDRPSDLPAAAKWVKTYPAIPTDPWLNEYKYRRLPDDDPRGFEIIFLGPDGVPSDDDHSSLDE